MRTGGVCTFSLCRNTNKGEKATRRVKEKGGKRKGEDKTGDRLGNKNIKVSEESRERGQERGKKSAL